MTMVRTRLMCISLCYYLNYRRSATPRVLISLVLASTGTWSWRVAVAALDSLPEEQEGCGRNGKHCVNGRQSELSTLQSLFETALFDYCTEYTETDFILYTSTCDQDRELCRCCAPRARTQQGRAPGVLWYVWPDIADYLYNRGEGQTMDISHWGVLKIEVEICPK
ncbi:hypothetical protein BJV78DRAFT_1221431 [Lactifluus subvellereus]|nr:hypothetical protein BJV78DRAFT_1221431 [Lactifluus subvellereus]